jgi:hypothetical protein
VFEVEIAPDQLEIVARVIRHAKARLVRQAAAGEGRLLLTVLPCPGSAARRGQDETSTTA